MELVQMPIGRFALDVSAKIRQFRGIQEIGSVGMGLSDLQIRLAVQISGLYERHTLWLRRRQQNQISGEESVVVNLYISKRMILAG